MEAEERITLVFERLSPEEMRRRASACLARAERRRSVRHFSSDSVDPGVLRDCIGTAALAPSGANKQPWTFVLVTEPETKSRVRREVEAVERELYEQRAPDSWLSDIRPLGTSFEKPHIEEAPALIAVFAQTRGVAGKHYYVTESVGIAIGFLISALHECGLATLVHTPTATRRLSEVFGRPPEERLTALLPVGYPIDGCTVPAITRRPLSQVLVQR